MKPENRESSNSTSIIVAVAIAAAVVALMGGTLLVKRANFQRLQEAERVHVNLALIAASAKEYWSRTDTTSVSTDELFAEGSPYGPILQVADETYDLTITTNTTRLTTEVRGRKVSYDF